MIQLLVSHSPHAQTDVVPRGFCRPVDARPLAILLAAILLTATSRGAGQQVALLSPRMEELRQAVARQEAGAVDDFWREVSERHTPLVEPIPGEEHFQWLTFLWRGDDTTYNVVLAGGPAPGHPDGHRFARLEQTDVWYRTVRMRDDLRTTYYLSPNDPLTALDFSDGPAIQARAQRLKRDPFAVRQDFAGSVVELSNAPPQPWIAASRDVPKGTLHAQQFSSRLLNNQRTVTVYRPPDYANQHSPYPLLIVFDLEAYTLSVPTPTILNNLIAAGRIAPCVALLVGNAAGARPRELACNASFADFMTQELLPWLRQGHRVADDPRQVVAAGSSLGGLCAAYLAWRHPDMVGNAICQSASLNWSPEETRSKFDPAVEGEWLTRQFAIAPRREIRFALEAGLWETVRIETRHLRDVLQAKGYDVARYSEYNGAHDYLNWRGSLADNLMALLPPSSASDSP